MTAKVERFIISSKGFDDFIEITSKIQNLVSLFRVSEGMVNICVTSPCTSLKIVEGEPGLNLDISKMMDFLVPINKIYQHDNVWHDGNAHAHLKTILFGNSLTLPVFDSKVCLGTHQQIVLLDFDNKASQKEIIVSMVY